MNFLFLVVIFFSHPQAHAVQKGVVATEKKFSLSKLQKTYKDAGAIESDFVQETYQASLARTKTSKGSLKLAKPAFLRWETYEPEAGVMVSNGKKLWYFNPDARGKGKGQVMERSPKALQSQPIFKILTGNSQLDTDFTLEKSEILPLIGKEGKRTVLSLKPKKAMADVALTKLTVDANYLISEIIIENQSGNTTKITLQNQVLGAKLPPVLFDFKPPQGSEILRNEE